MYRIVNCTVPAALESKLGEVVESSVNRTSRKSEVIMGFLLFWGGCQYYVVGAFYWATAARRAANLLCGCLFSDGISSVPAMLLGLGGDEYNVPR